MERVFFGKISKRFPIQLEQNFYAAGPKDSSWYGGIEEGDYVFPIYQGKVSKLWRVVSFDKDPNPVNSEGKVNFEVVKEYAEPIPLVAKFVRYKHFNLDLNLLNKCIKSTVKVGFFPISMAESCPPLENIDFDNSRNIFIALERTFQEISFREGDLRVLVEGEKSIEIKEIQIIKSGKFERYAPLHALYLEKNKPDERYDLTRLLDFAIKDHATNKEKYLRAVIDGIQKKGYFKVISPIKLYDNILVGRKKTKRRSTSSTVSVPVPVLDSDHEMEDYDEYQDYVELLKFSPNLILYGPPGTGKTYSVEKIIEAFEYDRTNEAKTFQTLNEEGRIRFVTFHQSFSYEEFVEGLRPVTTTEEEIQEGGGVNLKYTVQPGILRQIANKAVISQLQKEFKKDELKNLNESSNIWKVSLGARGKEESVYNDCISSETIAIGWLAEHNLEGWNKRKIYEKLKAGDTGWSENPTNDADSINKFVNEIQIGDIVLIFASVTSIRAVGVVEGDYFRDESKSYGYPHRRKVTWLKTFETPIDILRYNGNVRLTMKTIYELSRIKFSDIKEMLEMKDDNDLQTESEALPHFLVIDEINRGNISKIFGELITLVEKDKRDKVKLQLPYSQSIFSLPSNLYLIGTMNTADRSIAILDTALRRRFVFKELEPNSEVIRADNPIIEDDIDLANLLDTINERIAQRVDRDHRIGHSYFLNIYDLNQLKIVWYYQILPLLMEYFYNDGEAIAEVVTDAFIDKRTSQIKWISSDSEFKNAILQVY
jgi:5-methylcytosine-specific restriction protein B